MNILYGVSGEGLGHAFRAISVAKYLEAKGHKILIITYGQAYPIFKDKFSIIRVNGLHVMYHNGEAKNTKTILFNIKNFSKNISKIDEIIKRVNNFNPDLCITDMEPFSSYISHFYKLPLISLSNQNLFLCCHFNLQNKFIKDYLIAKSIIKAITPTADYYITLSLDNMKLKNKNCYLVSPIIRQEILRIKPKSKKYVVVYLSRENQSVLNLLKKVKESFIVYGYNINKKEANLQFKKKEHFIKDFINCKAIISTSGFTSISEAIYLKKPYLALPLKGQFEQVFNAIYLKRKEFGDYSNKLTLKQLNTFLKNINYYKDNLNKFQGNLKSVYPVLDEILDKIQSTRNINN